MGFGRDGSHTRYLHTVNSTTSDTKLSATDGATKRGKAAMQCALLPTHHIVDSINSTNQVREGSGDNILAVGSGWCVGITNA